MPQEVFELVILLPAIHVDILNTCIRSSGVSNQCSVSPTNVSGTSSGPSLRIWSIALSEDEKRPMEVGVGLGRRLELKEQKCTQRYRQN